MKVQLSIAVLYLLLAFACALMPVQISKEKTFGAFRESITGEYQSTLDNGLTVVYNVTWAQLNNETLHDVMACDTTKKALYYINEEGKFVLESYAGNPNKDDVVLPPVEDTYHPVFARSACLPKIFMEQPLIFMNKGEVYGIKYAGKFEQVCQRFGSAQDSSYSKENCKLNLRDIYGEDAMTHNRVPNTGSLIVANFDSSFTAGFCSVQSEAAWCAIGDLISNELNTKWNRTTNEVAASDFYDYRHYKCENVPQTQSITTAQILKRSSFGVDDNESIVKQYFKRGDKMRLRRSWTETFDYPVSDDKDGRYTTFLFKKDEHTQAKQGLSYDIMIGGYLVNSYQMPQSVDKCYVRPGPNWFDASMPQCIKSTTSVQDLINWTSFRQRDRIIMEGDFTIVKGSEAAVDAWLNSL